MPYIETSQMWLTLSSQLLEARPTTTRIMTKYSITPAKARAAAKKASVAADSADSPMPDAAAPKPPRGKLILKTFDPVSGVCLKYKTAKAAEVGRLVQMLGSLGRNMGGLKASPITATATAAAVEEDSGVATPVTTVGISAVGGGAGEGGKGKKKKKGKK